MIRSLVFAGILGTILLLPNASNACSCASMGNDPLPCQYFWDSPVVFSGRVTEILPFTPPAHDGMPAYEQRLVRFQVGANYRGTTEPVAEIITGRGGGDCGYNFVAGREYLVYAYQQGAQLGTNICSPTKLLSDAGTDLEYINGLASAKSAGSILGTISHYKPRHPDQEWQPNQPFDSLRVWLEGTNGRIETFTDAAGKYSFADLVPGDYLLKIVPPAGSFPLKVESQVKVPVKGCSIRDYSFEPNTSISGQLLDEFGSAAAGILLELFPAESINDKYITYHPLAESDRNGYYTFQSIPAGRYYLGIRVRGTAGLDLAYPRTFFPGTQSLEQAAVLVVQDGQVQDGFTFQLPPKLGKRTIKGVVVFPDGKPAPNAVICFEEVPGNCTGGDESMNPDGTFTFTRLNGLGYRLRAFVNLPDGRQKHAEPIAIPSKGNVKKLRVVLSEPNGSCEKCR